ncbi:MAG TPA: M28 family metallopeptidase [Kofleriaceae bacterium]|nr:M28 family metallopeptidase [Kofleriaceae bacterium]
MKALFVLALVGCSAGTPGPGIAVDRAMAHARTLVELGPRVAETAVAKSAAAYVGEHLPRASRAHVGTVEVPAIEVLGSVYRRAHTLHTTDPNLVARFGPATGRALLLMAHYDSARGSPGAVDNAAAVGVLLELGRMLAVAPPPYPVIVAITAREEDGLVGAEALAASLGAEVDIAIAFDLVGGDGELVINGASTMIGAAELRWLAVAADRAGVTVRMPLAHRVISRWWPLAERSDHGAFTRRGIRALHLYHRGHDGELIDRAYHSPRDRYERIERASVDELGRFVVALVAKRPPPYAGDGFWVPQLANVVVPRWSLVAAEVVLLLVTALALVRMRRDRARGGAGLLAGIACTVVAFASVLFLERVALAYPLAWLHTPGLHVIAEALVLVGVLGLATRLVARRTPWIGARRYLVVAIALLVAFGVALLAIGAAELAWIWLVPAACASFAPFVGRARAVVLVPTLLPALLVLDPAQLREIAWNGFAPAAVPLVAWLALVGMPPLAAAAYALRARHPAGPLGAFVLPVGWALSIALGSTLIVRASPPCSASQFSELHLGCEMRSGV